MKTIAGPAATGSPQTYAEVVNNEPQAAPQICTGKRADHSAAFGGGGIKNKKKKKRSGSQLTGVEQLQIGEKENEVAELGDQVLCGKGMLVDVEKGCFTANLILGEKAAEERWTGGPNKALENQTKGDRLDTTANGKETMGCGANKVRAECSKAHITQKRVRWA
ncbi:hypothetical protein Ancab_032104 [Ancistrocladus abbreviatus]